MEKLLPADFTYEKYGVKARLVTEADAEFITALRSDAKLGRYLHASDGDVQKQIEWTREYKKREAEGLDYYFIFSKDGEDFGLCRIYNIDWTHLSFTSGSWLMKRGLDMTLTMVPSVITGEIAHDILGLLVDLYDVRKDNTHVLNFHRKIMKAIEYGETESVILFMSTPASRKNSKLRMILDIQ